MDITVSADAQRLIEEKISSGEFRSADAVVEEALRVMRERDEAYGQWLRAAVEQGEVSVAAGRVIPLDDAFWSSLRERIRSKAR